MSETDWNAVRKAIESEAPIPYDPEDGPYDPNDAAATERYFRFAITQGPEQRANGTGTIQIDLDEAVLDFFSQQGDLHERIASTLKQYVEQQRLAKAS